MLLVAFDVPTVNLINFSFGEIETAAISPSGISGKLTSAPVWLSIIFSLFFASSLLAITLYFLLFDSTPAYSHPMKLHLHLSLYHFYKSFWNPIHRLPFYKDQKIWDRVYLKDSTYNFYQETSLQKWLSPVNR